MNGFKTIVHLCGYFIVFYLSPVHFYCLIIKYEYDLGVFYTEHPQSDSMAMDRYIAFCEQNDLTTYIEPNLKVKNFVQDLTKTYPQLNDWPEDDIDNCPWSNDFDISEGHVIISMSFSRAEEISNLIIQLATKYGLVGIDPQSGAIFTAPANLYISKKPWWKFW